MTAPRIEDLREGVEVELIEDPAPYQEDHVAAGTRLRVTRVTKDRVFLVEAKEHSFDAEDVARFLRIPEPAPKCDACLFGNAAHQCDRPQGHDGAHACAPDAKKPFVTWGWESAPFADLGDAT